MNHYDQIPSDEDLRLRVKNFEDQFVERKTLGDAKDWLKTAVAFANSAPMNFPCVLYLGVKQDGTPQPSANHTNLEKLQQTFAEKVRVAYPAIPYYPRVFLIGSQQVLAIIIPGSELRPHFTQRPHVRVGQQTREATDQQFEQMIAARSTKAAYIISRQGKLFDVHFLRRPSQPGRISEIWTSCNLIECNQFFLVIEYKETRVSIGLNRVEIVGLVDGGGLKLEVSGGV